MNVFVLAEQADDPTLHSLSSLAVLHSLPPGELDISAPVVILGTITSKPSRYLHDLCQQAYQGNFPLLFVPPWPARSDMSDTLATPASLIVERRAGDQISVSDAALCAAMGKGTLAVRCDQVIVTPLSMGVLARNQHGPVLFRYRPSNTATPIYLTTLQVLTPSSRSVTLDRERMMKALLQLVFSNSRTIYHSNKPKVILHRTTNDERRLVVLALAHLKNTHAADIQRFIQARLYVDISLERLSDVLAEFHRAGYLESIEPVIQVNLNALNKLVASLGLTAYVRELAEE
ncbi:MAG: hypothetical protein PHQ40_00800 [Anaerolineaceae bacterium]|nr:hypothetical protein [Anaerolineaceae bacterium]